MFVETFHPEYFKVHPFFNPVKPRMIKLGIIMCQEKFFCLMFHT